jgi:hypothetical protein
MDRTRKLLRLNVGGKWSARQVSRGIAAIDDLYNLRLLLQLVYEDVPEIVRKNLSRHGRFPDPFLEFPYWRLGFQGIQPDKVLRLVEPSERLMARRLDYASPGMFDLAGLGAIVGHIKDGMMRLVDIYVSRPQRKNENEERGLKNDALRIQNAREFISLAKELGYSEQEIRQLVLWVDQRQQRLGSLIRDGLIIGVEVLPDEQGEG